MVWNVNRIANISVVDLVPKIASHVSNWLLSNVRMNQSSTFGVVFTRVHSSIMDEFTWPP